MASIAIDGVSFWGRGGTSRGFGGGVEERRTVSRLARGSTAARGAEFGAEVGGGSIDGFEGLDGWGASGGGLLPPGVPKSAAVGFSPEGLGPVVTEVEGPA